MYTARFTEQYALLGSIRASAADSEQNTGYLACNNYPRVVAIIWPISMGSATIDVDVETATDTSGTSAKTFDSGSKDITIANADTKPSVIEIRGEEFDEANAFDCLNIEATPSAAATFLVEVWGYASELPASTTNLDSVTD